MRNRDQRKVGRRFPDTRKKTHHGRRMVVGGEEYTYKVSPTGIVIYGPDGKKHYCSSGEFTDGYLGGDMNIHPRHVRAYIEAGFKVPEKSWYTWKNKAKADFLAENHLSLYQVPFDMQRNWSGPYLISFEVHYKGEPIGEIVKAYLYPKGWTTLEECRKQADLPLEDRDPNVFFPDEIAALKFYLKALKHGARERKYLMANGLECPSQMIPTPERVEALQKRAEEEATRKMWSNSRLWERGRN